MRCSKCGSDNREGRKFCAKCGGPLARLCSQCGTSNEPGEDFCGECGTSLSPPPAVHTDRTKTAEPQVRIGPEALPALLDGERKTVTVLFADIKGSMELMEDLAMS